MRLPETLPAQRPILATGFLRYCMLCALFQNRLSDAQAVADNLGATTPELSSVIKSAVAAGTTTDPTWASPLRDHSNMVGLFLEALRPQTAMGRIPGLTPLPFRSRALVQTSRAVARWIGEAKPIGLTSQAFTGYQLDPKKLAAIIVLTLELQDFADSGALAAMQRDLIAACSEAADKSFLDPSFGATSDRPASITHNAPVIHSTGNTVAAIITDFTAAMQLLLDAGSTLRSAAWVFNPSSALYISGLHGTAGPAFPGLSVVGGSFLGLPVVTSSTLVPSGSPGERFAVLVDGSRIILCEGVTVVDGTREASLQMDDDPSDPATSTINAFQENAAAVRVVRFLNWQAAPGAVAVVDNLTF